MINNYYDRLMKNTRFIYLQILLLLTILAGCSNGDGNGSSTTLTPQEVVDLGWVEFEDHNYIDAKSEFETAIQMDGNLSDAFNGAGWSSGRIPGGLQDAKSHFTAAINLDTTAFDAKGGLIFAEFQLGEWQTVLNRIDTLLKRLPGWRFLHESTVDFQDLRLMTALCYYNLGNYTSALGVIVNINYLNPQFDVDVSTESGRRELLEEIERLGVIHG